MKTLIIMAGLPGTGKSITGKKLAEELGYKFISQNDVRREHGMKDMPDHQPNILRDVDKKVFEELKSNGVVLDAVHRFGHRRHQLYGIASGLGVDVIVVECICSEDEAKKRMEQRPDSDGLIVDANIPKVYDEVKAGWEDIEDDLYDFSSHVSYIKYDTERNKFEIIVGRDSAKGVIKEVGDILTK